MAETMVDTLLQTKAHTLSLDSHEVTAEALLDTLAETLAQAEVKNTSDKLGQDSA